MSATTRVARMTDRSDFGWSVACVFDCESFLWCATVATAPVAILAQIAGIFCTKEFPRVFVSVLSLSSRCNFSQGRSVPSHL